MAFGKGFVRDAWYFVALARDVPVASLKRYEVMDEPVLVGRTRAGAVYAMRDICPPGRAAVGRASGGQAGRGRDDRVPLSRLALPSRRRLRRHSVPGRGSGLRGQSHQVGPIRCARARAWSSSGWPSDARNPSEPDLRLAIAE